MLREDFLLLIQLKLIYRASPKTFSVKLPRLPLLLDRLLPRPPRVERPPPLLLPLLLELPLEVM